MHMFTVGGRVATWICLFLLVATATAVRAAVVYKWTDAAGVVHFSDQETPGAEKIIVSSGNINGMIGGRTAAPAVVQPGSPATPAKRSVTVVSPAPEQVFFADDVIPVRLQVTPALQPSQSITWSLNGAVLDQPRDAVSFSLQELARGAYVISATVTDSVTGTTQTSDSVTFYERQPSELSPQHQKH